MKTKLFNKTAIPALMLILVMMFAGCGDDPGDDDGTGSGSGGNETLSGNITIVNNTEAKTAHEVGDTLKAVYTGGETVSYQWKKDSSNVGTNAATFTTTEAGSYTVTVSATGYNPKTSTAVTVNAVDNHPSVVPGADLAAKLAWLKANARANLEYTIEVDKDETIDNGTTSFGPALTGYTFNAANLNNATGVKIKLIGTTTERKIYATGTSSTDAGDCSLFTVESGYTLTLGNNIHLTRDDAYDFNGCIVRVNSGTLIMEAGSKISKGIGTANGSGIPGGVKVSDGTFTMNGGEISENTGTAYGAGVQLLSDATFTMNGGTITNNKATSISTADGGGVYVQANFNYNNGVTFTMNGGSITNNETSGEGGGVCMGGGTFTMNGGTISGNKAAYGGGVQVGNVFTMNGGEISGNQATYKGGGVYVRGTFTKLAKNDAEGIPGGVVYGSDATDEAKKNTAGTSGAVATEYLGSDRELTIAAEDSFTMGD